MTIIGAVSTSEGAWIAADSLIAHPHAGYGVSGDKIERCSTEQLARAWFGSSAQGDLFDAALLSHQGGFLTWDNLAYFMEGTARQLDLQAGTERFGVVFAGCLGDEWSVRVFAKHILREEDPGSGAVFVGFNRLPALVGWRLTADSADVGERLRRVMATVIDASHPFLCPPVQMWQITDTLCGPHQQTTQRDVKD